MKTIEVSIKDIFVAVSRRWFSILIASVVLAVLLGYFNYNKYQADIKAYGSGIEMTISGFESEKESIVKQISEANNIIDMRKTNYSQTAVLSFVVKMEAVTSNDTSKSDSVESSSSFGKEINRSIVDYYQTLAKEASYSEILKDKNPGKIPESDLHAIIYLKMNNGVISIESSNLHGISGMDLVQSIFDYLDSKRTEAVLVFGAHRLEITEHYMADRVSDLWAEDVKYYEKKVKEHETALKDIDNKIEAEKAKLLNPEDEMKSLKSGFMMNLVFSFIIGISVAVFAAIIGYLLYLPIVLPEQIKRQLGVKYLGGVKRKQSILTSGLGNRLAGILLQSNDSEAVELISANLDEAKGECRQILLTGTVSEPVISEFAKKLSEKYPDSDVTFSHGGDVNGSVESVRKLAKADGVILVERLNVSRLRDVNRLLERIEGSGKPIVGYVFF